MVYIKRYIEDEVKEDLGKKMVFISGPRQSGKTTLGKKILHENVPQGTDRFYLNWDSARTEK